MELHRDARTVLVLSTHDDERHAIDELLSPHGFRIVAPREDESPDDAVERTGAGALLVSGRCDDAVLAAVVGATSTVFVPVLLFGTHADHLAMRVNAEMLNLPFAELEQDGEMVVRVLALTGGQREVN